MTTFTAPISPYTVTHDPNTWAEIKRIIALNLTHALWTEELEYVNRTHVMADAYANGFRLSPLQAQAVSTYEIHDSLFAAMGVGLGKTLVSLMCASIATSKGFDRILLHVPSPVLSQLVLTDIPWARSRVHINFPVHVLGGKAKDFRRALSASGRRGMYIMPYSLMSTEDTSDNLAAIAPQLIILDEGHQLANHSAARTRRFLANLRKLTEMGKTPEVCLLSGTITGKSIKDYYYLIKACLKQNCPLPLSERMATEWAILIDAQASGPEAFISPLGSAPIMPVVQWARQHFPDFPGGFPEDVYGFRKAYSQRLNTAPGVVASGDSELGTSLILQNRPVEGYQQHKDYPRLKELIDGVEDRNETPNGDVIAFAIHKWKWLNELTCGFYNELTWPTVPVYAKRKGIGEFEAKGILERAQLQHKVAQEYDKILREFLKTHYRVGVDTPFLCGQDMMRNGSKNVGEEMYTAWKDAKDLEFEDMPERDSRGVRVADFKIAASVKWAQELDGKGGIIWYHHQEVGNWLTEALQVAGVSQKQEVIHCPAGEHANRVITDTAHRKSLMVASISAHGQGKNLQHFEEMLVLQWPRSAKLAEQLLGRLHRRGQMADELYIRTMHTMQFDEENFAACLNDSLYIHQSVSNKQKLIYAAYDPNPRNFPPAVLEQRGLEISHLSPEKQREFDERFNA